MISPDFPIKKNPPLLSWRDFHVKFLQEYLTRWDFSPKKHLQVGQLTSLIHRLREEAPPEADGRKGVPTSPEDI